MCRYCGNSTTCNDVASTWIRGVVALFPYTWKYVPGSVAILGITFNSVLFLALISTAFLGLYWQHFDTRHLSLLNYIVLSTLIVVSCLRIVFWSVGWVGYIQGYGATFSETTFYVLDKTAALLFVFTVTLFLFTWIKAVHLAIFINKMAIRVAAISLSVLTGCLFVACITLTVMYVVLSWAITRSNLTAGTR